MKIIGAAQMLFILAMIAIVCAVSDDYSWNPRPGSEL